jgi:hypothetical protein
MGIKVQEAVELTNSIKTLYNLVQIYRDKEGDNSVAKTWLNEIEDNLAEALDCTDELLNCFKEREE